MANPAIQNVFVLMLENRSFDHMLGCSGITGTDIVSGQTRAVNGPTGISLQYQGTSYPVGTPGINPMPIDPGHEFSDVLEQLCGKGVDYSAPYPPINIGQAGYLDDYASLMTSGGPGKVDDPLGCMSPTQVPVICGLAQSFLVCDGWCSSMPGPTVPNRFFVHAASSGGLDHSPTQFQTLDWMAFGYSFQNGTIFDRLAGASGLNSFRIYQGDSFSLAHMLPNMNFKYASNFYPYTSFASDVTKPSYRSIKYTFIEPSYGNFTGDFTCGTSQHPLDDITRGEWLIKCSYEAIRSSPLWDTSLLVVVWDEHGGFYDHVEPPSATPPGDKEHEGINESGFTFAQLGPRVPAVIVSPFIPANTIDGRCYEHSSLPATLEALFGLAPLTARDSSVANLTRVLTLSDPRTDAPIALASPATPANMKGCMPIGSCGNLPTAANQEARLRAVASSPEGDKPLVGNHPAFLLAALQRDLASTPPVQHPGRLERFRRIGPTRRDAAVYVLEVSERARAAQDAAQPTADGDPPTR